MKLWAAFIRFELIFYLLIWIGEKVWTQLIDTVESHFPDLKNQEGKYPPYRAIVQVKGQSVYKSIWYGAWRMNVFNKCQLLLQFV